MSQQPWVSHTEHVGPSMWMRAASGSHGPGFEPRHSHKTMGLVTLTHTVMVELTNACNLRCITCGNRTMKRKRGFMSHDIFESILIQATNCAIHRLKLYTVGEPLLHPDAVPMVARAKQSGFHVSLSTNGMLLDGTTIDGLKAAGVDFVQVSWVPDRATYERIYIGGDHKRVGDAVDIMRKQLPYTSFKLGSTAADGQTTVWAGRDSWRSPAKGISPSVPDMGPIIMKNNCESLVRRIGVLHDGRITACACLDVEGEFIVGDIAGANGLRDAIIAKDDVVTKFRTSGAVRSDLCYSCSTLRRTNRF